MYIKMQYPLVEFIKTMAYETEEDKHKFGLMVLFATLYFLETGIKYELGHCKDIWVYVLNQIYDKLKSAKAHLERGQELPDIEEHISEFRSKKYERANEYLSNIAVMKYTRRILNGYKYTVDDFEYVCGTLATNIFSIYSALETYQ